MACTITDELDRIATALETMVEAEDARYVTFGDVLEALNITPSEETADLIEAFQYLGGLLPGLPELKIPVASLGLDIGTMRYRGAMLQLLNDIALSQRGQTTALGGVDYAGLYDTMGETADKMLVSAGYLGKAYWLWRWVSNDQIPGWVTWFSTITGLALGSVRGAAYDIAEAITGIDLSGVEEAIRDQTNVNITNCNSCTAKQLYNIINDDSIQNDNAVVEHDSVWPDVGEPPVSDDTTWTEPEFPDDTKCQGARYIVGWLIGFYGREEWNLEETDNMMTLADKMKNVLALIPPIGVALNGASIIIGRLLAYLSGGDTDIFNTLNEVLVDLEEELVCAIYLAEGPVEAREAFIAILNDDERLTGIEQQFLEVFLTMNNVMALPFYVSEAVQPYIESFGTECDCTADPASYTIILGTGSDDTNPVVGEGANETGYGCGTTKGFTVNFHVGVNITAIILTDGYSLCGGANLVYYYSGEDYTDLISSGNSFPQDSGGTTGYITRCIYVIWLPGTGDGNIEIQYEIAP